MDKQTEFVLRSIEERDIRFVRLWFTDVLGTLKSVAIAPAELEGAFEEGLGFDGSAIEGFARVHESDMLAMPDPATAFIDPFCAVPTLSLTCTIAETGTRPAGVSMSWAARSRGPRAPAGGQTAAAGAADQHQGRLCHPGLAHHQQPPAAGELSARRRRHPGGAAEGRRGDCAG